MKQHDAVVLSSRLSVVLHLWVICLPNVSGTKWYVDDGPHLEKQV